MIQRTGGYAPHMEILGLFFGITTESPKQVRSVP